VSAEPIGVYLRARIHIHSFGEQPARDLDFVIVDAQMERRGSGQRRRVERKRFVASSLLAASARALSLYFIFAPQPPEIA